MAKKRMQMAQKSWEIEEILPISKESKTIDCLMETRTQFSSFQQSKSMVLFTEYPCLPRAINHLYRHIITGEPGRKRTEYCAEPKRQSLRQHRTIRQEPVARDFSSAESLENRGILGVFPVFQTVRMGEKTRHPAADAIVQCCPNTVTLLTSHSDSITGFRRRTPKTTRTYSYPRMAMEGTPNKYTIGFQWNASLKSPLSVAATARPEPQPGQYNPVRS